MNTFTRFEELDVWKKSRSVALAVYKLTELGKFSRDFSLRDQVRRCAVSMMANVAEGFGRKSPKEFALFLNYAHGSAAELQSHLYIAMDLGYIGEEDFKKLYADCERVSRMSLGLQKYLRKLPKRY